LVAPLEIIILAAGQGTRMKSALPKVLHPLAGKPLLAHVIERSQALVPNRIEVVYGHRGDQVREALAEFQIDWIKQSEQLGTGHAVEQAMPQISPEAMVLILYGDVPLVRSETLQSLLSVAEVKGFALLTVELAEPAGYGRIVRGAGGNVERIVEEKDATAEERSICEVNTGIMALPASHLARWLKQLDNDNAQGEFYLTDIIALAVNEGITVEAVITRDVDEVLGVNDRLQLAHLERQYQRRNADSLMRAGVTLIDPARFDQRGTLDAGQDVILDVGVIVEGEVILGDRVKVGANCLLKNVTVGDDVEILPMSIIEQAEIGPCCTIGPFARIRPGTTLAEGAKVGNFVEIKNSSVDKGSKINHLSYIGDTTMGSGVNIGAGTITCNYDGANKHRTVIGDGAFIGSDTQLVAPVQVGNDATIGAGSTITRDTPEGGLTLSRSKQTTIEGWKRPEKKRDP
jgi:bifunctional UDP-N-acetylglucosamine pyrophosphorylase/glucosamine-1-phosphate N-acetyltransferase